MRRCWFFILLALIVDLPVFGDTAESGRAAPEWQTGGPPNGRLYDAVLLGNCEPVKLKCFGADLRGSVLCVLGGTSSQKQLTKIEKMENTERTLIYWLKDQNKRASQYHDPIFNNGVVSYVVSFDGRDDVGNLRLSHGGSKAANERALKMLQRITPLPEPPDDAPYRRGLLFRFTSRKVEIELAPEHHR